DNMQPSVTVHRLHGEAALTLRAAELEATFLPDVGMLGVSLCYRGDELLALWANRLAGSSYRAGGVNVELDGLTLHTDDNGLPIHGTMTAQRGWEISA